VAYIGYDSGLHSAPARARPARFRLAWSRLAMVAISALAWMGLLAATRAIF